MSNTSVMHHVYDDDKIRATVRVDDLGRPYAAVNLGDDVTLFAHEPELLRLHDVIGIALAGVTVADPLTAVAT